MDPIGLQSEKKITSGNFIIVEQIRYILLAVGLTAVTVCYHSSRNSKHNLGTHSSITSEESEAQMVRQFSG